MLYEDHCSVVIDNIIKNNVILLLDGRRENDTNVYVERSLIVFQETASPLHLLLRCGGAGGDDNSKKFKKGENNDEQE